MKFITALFALWVGSVHAGEENCTFTSFLMQPGFLFYDSGTYAGGSKRATGSIIIECQRKDSPLYAQFVTILPEGLGAGTQANGRIGSRFTHNNFDYDLSVALYNNKVDQSNVEQTINLRATVSKSISGVLGGTITPYIWLEEQKPLRAREHYFGGRWGVSYSTDFASLPSTPTFTVGISQYHYFSTPTVGKTIATADTYFGFHPQIGSSKFTIGPYYRRTQGSIETSDRGVSRSMFGLLMSISF